MTPRFAAQFLAALAAWGVRELWHGFKRGRAR